LRFSPQRKKLAKSRSACEHPTLYKKRFCGGSADNKSVPPGTEVSLN